MHYFIKVDSEDSNKYIKGIHLYAYFVLTILQLPADVGLLSSFCLIASLENIMTITIDAINDAITIINILVNSNFL